MTPTSRAEDAEPDPRLVELLGGADESLRRFVSRRAGGFLLRYETVDDLVQAVHYEALRSAKNFEYRDEEQARSWLFQVARRLLSDRRDYWRALRRNGAKVVRLSASQSGTGGGARIEPAFGGTGPSTFAARREQLVLAAKALALLLPRDRDLVLWWSQGLSIEEIAERLGVSYDAAGRARLRALERLRKTHAIVTKTKLPGTET